MFNNFYVALLTNNLLFTKNLCYVLLVTCLLFSSISAERLKTERVLIYICRKGYDNHSCSSGTWAAISTFVRITHQDNLELELNSRSWLTHIFFYKKELIRDGRLNFLKSIKHPTGIEKVKRLFWFAALIFLGHSKLLWRIQ